MPARSCNTPVDDSPCVMKNILGLLAFTADSMSAREKGTDAGLETLRTSAPAILVQSVVASLLVETEEEFWVNFKGKKSAPKISAVEKLT